MKLSSVEIIYNPNSSGDSQRLAWELEQELRRQIPQLPVRLHATEHAGHAEELAYSLARKYPTPLIVSASGDGGYNEVVNGLMKARKFGARPVGAVLAAGNANDHSRTLIKTPLAELIRKQDIVSLDLLKVTIDYRGKRTERYAHSYVGFGLTSVVAAQLNKTDVNTFKEMIIMLRSFYKYRPVAFEYKGKVVRVDSVIFANIGEMAKIFTISKTSKPDDGLFEAVTLRHKHKLMLLRNLLQASTEGLDIGNQYTEVSFKALKKTPAQLDGEVMYVSKGSTIDITVEAGILQTLIG